MKLTIHHAVGGGDQSAIWFDNNTPAGPVPSCDWLRIENSQIREIRSFYDPTLIRQVLTNDEQSSLDQPI